MQERTIGWRQATSGAIGALLLMAGAIPATAAERVLAPESLPRCGSEAVTASTDGNVASPWRAVLDDDGAVAEHRVTLRQLDGDTVLRTGRRGFAVAPSAGRLLIGERGGNGTSLVMVDTERGCHVWTREIPQLAYDASPSDDGRAVRVAAHALGTRDYEGALELDAETGATNAMIEGQCTTSCQPNDGDVPDAAFMPAALARPVPAFAGGGWTPRKVLAFSWQSGNVPPVWARPALLAAADDANRSSVSRSPTYRFGSDSSNSVRYGSSFPTFCRFGIACASRAMPAWAVWIRPHGTDFSWGDLRWCEKTDTDGCFDLRRVMLHELGHIAGLNHPSTAGFRLDPYETVMHAITPARPQPASRRHIFGRCDVATLQELYDLPGSKALVSTCNSVATAIGLATSSQSVSAGETVRLVAELKIKDRAEYGRLGGRLLDGRTVKLKYRPAGTSEAWTTAWMRPLEASGRYGATIVPGGTSEFKAVFPAPEDEGLHFGDSPIMKVKVTP